MKTIPGLIGTIYLADGDEIQMADNDLLSKRKAIRRAKKIKRTGIWVSYEDGESQFIFPENIENIQVCRRANVQEDQKAEI